MKTKCEYCHGRTEDDARGQCVACGAPKKDEEVKEPEYIYYHPTLGRVNSFPSTDYNQGYRNIAST